MQNVHLAMEEHQDTLHKHYIRIAEGLANYWKRYTEANSNRDTLSTIEIKALGAAGLLVFLSSLKQEDTFFEELLLMNKYD